MPDQLCGTRILKNARRLRQLAPGLSALGPGVTMGIEPGLLANLHRLDPSALARRWRGDPQLLEAAATMRKEATSVQPRLGRTANFRGTIHFTQFQILVEPNQIVAVGANDVTTAIQYATLAIQPILYYCGQYGGQSSVRAVISQQAILFTTEGETAPSYDDNVLQDWVNEIAEKNGLTGSDCVVILNPPQALNTDANRASGIGGYHDYANIPYCFVNVGATGLSVADPHNTYAETLSHEIAEMLVDPHAAWGNPEVCDPCAGNCSNRWLNFYSTGPNQPTRFLEWSQSIPSGLSFAFFTAAVTTPEFVSECPSPTHGCAYPPPLPEGFNELLFYDAPAGAGEFYVVNDMTEIDIGVQFAHTDWRTTWKTIVPGSFFVSTRTLASKLLFYDAGAGRGEFWTRYGGTMQLTAGIDGWRTDWDMIIPGHFSDSPNTDLLFYERASGTGEFYRTDGSFSLIGSNPDWRQDWTIVVPGHFSDGPYTDLLFYEASTGTGEFWRTDGEGNISQIGVSNTDWRRDWTMIIPGTFSNGRYLDLLFYEASTGTGEFWRTDGKGNISLITSYTDWRQSWNIIFALDG